MTIVKKDGKTLAQRLSTQYKDARFRGITNVISLVLVLSLAVFASGCGGMLKGEEAAEKSAADFHKLYNDGKFSEIYSSSDSKFKSETTEKQFLELMSAVQRKLGKVTQTSTPNINIRTFNFTTTVILNKKTTFEQGTGMEVFTFQMDGGKAVLVGYNIDSKDLILK